MALALVDGILHGLELLKEKMDHDTVDDLQICLRALRTFLLCAGKWHHDVGFKSDENTSSISCPMESLLGRLEDSLIQNGRDFHSLCLRTKYATKSDVRSWRKEVLGRAVKLSRCIYSFWQEIKESYVTLTDYCSLQPGDQSMEFIDSLLLNVADVTGHQAWKDPFRVETLNGKLVFFKNFLRYAELRGLESRQFQVLFIHLHVVAINAARVCHGWMILPYVYRKKSHNNFLLKLSEVLLKIKPADPQVREIYVHVLMASNVPGSSHALSLERDKRVLRDFVDSLLGKILEALTYDDSYMVSMKDRVPMLYDGLRFLRILLMKHLKKIDKLHEKGKDLIRAAVNEAAIVICFQELEEDLAEKMDFALSNFLEKIKIIKIITSKFILPRTNEHGYIDFLLENLKELPSCTADSIGFAKNQIQTVQEDLASLVSFLESMLDQQNRDGTLQSFWSRAADVAYKTRFVIESLVVGDISDCSPSEFNLITEEINLIKMEAFNISENQCSSGAQEANKTSSPSLSEDNVPAINKIEGSLDDKANKLIGLLIGGSNPLDIISIVGMPGLGKTTLARRVYNDPSVREHFHSLAWCVVSHEYRKKDLLLQILCSANPNFSKDIYSKKNEEELEENLKKYLLKRRYLIVLDDVWDSEVWNSLEKSFPKDANSSRILITSRLAEVAKKINPNSEPHFLPLLTDDESWDLLQKKLSCRENYPLDLGKRIAKNCKGLPLTIVIVAGILANLEQDGWAEIATRLNLSDLPILDQCMDILEVSYKNLPECLKSCLLYFGAFREDEEISYKRLIWLWMAEGFVQKSEVKSLEDVAKDYMNDLISRSLVMVSEERAVGGVKTCHVHDMLHEFCVIKAKKEKFMSILGGHDEVFPFQVQRLCVHSTLKRIVKSRPFSSGVRSLLFFPNKSVYHGISHIFHFFKLQVLDLMHYDLGFDFPREILLLVHLRYLRVKGKLNVIPSTIANLSNLEVLFLVGTHQLIFLPVTVWNMSKLRVLQSKLAYLRFVLHKDTLEISSKLHILDTFSLVQVSYGQSFEKIMRKSPNIRMLNCVFSSSVISNADCNGIVAIDFLSQLESLHLFLPYPQQLPYPSESIRFVFPSNLKKLALSHFHFSIIPKGRELPNLQVLKLICIDYEGNAWDMNEELEFPNLRFLELNTLHIDRWTGTDGVDHFPSLEKLVLENCWNLKEVPSCLRDITSLQTVKGSYLRKSVVSLVMQIKEYQKEYWGNEDLQVLISEVNDDSSEDETEDDPSEGATDDPSEDETEDDPTEDDPTEDAMDDPGEDETEDDSSEDETEDDLSESEMEDETSDEE